jgi:hypothetical protein
MGARVYQGAGDSGGRGCRRIIQRTNSARRRNRDTESIGVPSHSRRLRISVAAIKAVSDTNGSFSDHRGMRQWVLSDEVISLAASGNWPTPETASLWKKFCAHFDSGENSQWSAIQFKSAVIWQKPPSPGSRVLIRASRYVESPDRTPLGTLKEPMRFPDSGIFEARISTDCAMVEGKWIGPTTC